jgi:thiamine biosynthesis lipoprotein
MRSQLEMDVEPLVGRFSHPVMGTVVSFDLHDPVSVETMSAVTRWLDHSDRVFSTYRRDSDISRLDRGECRLADCDPDVALVLGLCAHASTITDGYFSATAGGHLDPSGLVKGWAIERASELLRAAGSRHHVVNGGGDIQAVGPTADGTPWRVGISDPHDGGHLLCVVDVVGRAVATSGTAERGQHVLNPRTGRPADHFASVTVISARLTDADVLATAAIARGSTALDWLEQMPGVAALLVTTDGGVERTSGWVDAADQRTSASGVTSPQEK